MIESRAAMYSGWAVGSDGMYRQGHLELGLVAGTAPQRLRSSKAPPFSNVKRAPFRSLCSGPPAQVPLKRGGSAACSKSSSMPRRRAVASVTFRILWPAVQTSFSAMSVTSRRRRVAWKERGILTSEGFFPLRRP